MVEELAIFEVNNTWPIMPFPSNKNPIGFRWIYKVIYNENGSIE